MTPRRRWLLDEGWRFHLGDVPAPLPNKHIAAYMANKAGWARGAARGNFDDSDWRTVDLPHDWAIEGPIDAANHLSGGFLSRGIGWYRRYFALPDTEKHRKLTLQFDGVATHCVVYVNGHLLHRSFCGYTPITIDISDVAVFGDQPNVIAVRVDATSPEGWWYEGAGIYRHVWLTSTSRCHIGDVTLRPENSGGDSWKTNATLEILRDPAPLEDCSVSARVVDDRGNVIVEQTSQVLSGDGTKQEMLLSLPVHQPRLWSCESPSLYALITELRENGVLIDQTETRFGYRTIRFDADHGFFLNGNALKLRGTCNHQDHAGIGVALPDSIHEFRIRKLKSMGCNAYRAAHNPPAPELLDACDRLGLLVMNENRNFGSSPEHLSQLRALVVRDRNHPSVILWSICNEEAIQGTPVANRIGQAMVREVKSLDPTRPVMAAVSGGILNDDCLADAVEVLGINYQLAVNDAYHAKHPGKPLIASETHSVISTRGVYRTNRQNFCLSCRDDEIASWGASARETWKFVSERPHVVGLFAWTGFDYRGEPTPFEWPCVNSLFGILDTCGFEKDSFWLHKAFFSSEPFVRVSPHWNWQTRDVIEVKVYSNCSEVELFLDDESLGSRPVDRYEMAEWQVEWHAGRLRAVGRCPAGDVEHCVETTGPAVRIGLEIDPACEAKVLTADGEHALALTVFAVDAQGRRVPDAGHAITFSVGGPARFIGAGNGDPTCHQPDKQPVRSLFHGLAQIIVQSTGDAGEVTIRAESPQMEAGALILPAVAGAHRPRLPAVAPRYFINDWRMSPIRSSRPDPNEAIPEQDMNSWEHVTPAALGQVAWTNKAGYAIYRGKLSPPKKVQASGGTLNFHGIAGEAEIWIEGRQVMIGSDGSLSVPLSPGIAASSLSILIHSDSGKPAGLTGRVEIIAN